MIAPLCRHRRVWPVGLQRESPHDRTVSAGAFGALRLEALRDQGQ